MRSVRHEMPRVVFCRKTGHYERDCRGRRAAGRGLVGLIHEEGTEGWVTDPNEVAHG